MNARDAFGQAGSALWNAVTAQYEPGATELVVLAHACHEADIIDELQARIAEQPLLALGSRGQFVTSSHWAEIREHRAVFVKLLAQLC